jgi:DNA helicase II / ATP-dependent DNA helicase PcrA
MVGGMRFFDRAEIRLIIDYMRTVSHPDNNAAFLSIINVPSRKIGETAINSLVKLAEERNKTVWSVVQKVVTGSIALDKKLTAPAQKDLAKLVNLIKRARDKMSEHEPPAVPAQLISYLLQSLSVEAYLQQKYKDDFEDRIENIRELVAHATEHASLSNNVETLPIVDGAVQQKVDKCQESLDQFLANIVLTSEVEDKTDDKPRVTISTIHSAKGLEWPVVFVPSVYEGSIPHSRAEDNDEERRLLYVAITRAKALLNISLPLYSSREQQKLDLTQFLPQDVLHRTAEKAPSFNDRLIRDIATVLQREVPSQEDLARGVAGVGEKASAEDDIWPLDGREPLGPEQNTLLSDPNFPGRGMSLHEAEQQVKAGYQSYRANQAGSYGYQTSMTNANSFSTANTSMNMGFTTASQQLRSSATLESASGKAQNTNAQSAKMVTAPAKSKCGIKDFFASKSQPAAPTPAEAARQAWSSRPSASLPDSTLSKTQPELSTANTSAPARSFLDLAPELTAHRLSAALPGTSSGRCSAPGHKHLGAGIAGFKRPRPLPLEEISSNKEQKRQHYTFLSSSPTREDAEPGLLGEVVDLCDSDDEQENRPVKTSKDNGAALGPTTGATVGQVVRPMTPMTLAGKALGGGAAVTATSAAGAAYPKKRGLGVNRGSFVPWSQRKNK